MRWGGGQSKGDHGIMYVADLAPRPVKILSEQSNMK